MALSLRRARGAYLAGLIGLSVLSAACNANTNISPPRAFNRPARMAFVCFDTTVADVPVAVPLSQCQPTNLATNSGTGLQTYPTNRTLHALVTQSTRGEVAAVDLSNRVILDSDVRIPGATFVPVGELPSDIVVPAMSPTCAWVASAGRHTITSIPTPRFRPEHDRNVAEVVSEVRLPGRPAEMMLSPDERTLWVALPDLGAVARVAIDPVTCVAGAPDVIELAVDVPAGVMAVPGADVRRVCVDEIDDNATYIAPAATLLPRGYTAETPEARPTALEIDLDVDGDHVGNDAVLLIADGNLPLVHRIDMTTGAELPALNVGAPVHDLALTPWVPENGYAEGTGTPLVTTRFLYAIDGDDHTIMAIAYGAPSDPGFGAVLPIDGEFATRPDRMPLPAGAEALDVITPGYLSASDPRLATANPDDRYVGLCGGDDGRSPVPLTAVLRGVFLATAMIDSTVRISDVYDLDAPCRGPEACGGITNDPNVYIRRHRLRAGFPLNTLPAIFEGPQVNAANGSQVRIGNDGLAAPEPSLTNVACPLGMGAIFPANRLDGDPSLICTQLDPFSAAVEVWTAGWQGRLFSPSSDGNFGPGDAGEMVLESTVDFCERGVIGSTEAQAVPAGEPEAGYTGDLLAVIATLSDETLEMDDVCRRVVGIGSAGETPHPILVPIRRAYSHAPGLTGAYNGRLVLAENAPIIDDETGLPREGVTLVDALRCVGDELVTFDVRSHNAYTVAGTRTGLLHRVIEGTDGLCTIDTSAPRLHTHRAFLGQAFANTRVAFRIAIEGVGAGAPRAESVLRFRIGIVSTAALSAADAQLQADLGFVNSSTTARYLALPSDVIWNDMLQRTFVIEPQRRGLIEFDSPTFSIVAGTRLE